MNSVELTTAITQIGIHVDQNSRNSISHLQSNFLFSLRLLKLNRLREIAKQEPFLKKWRFIALRAWAPILDCIEWVKFDYIDYDFFTDISGNKVNEKIEFLNNSILICSNYPLQHGTGPEEITKTLSNFSALYHLCPNTVFLGWDWDNHFTLTFSSVLAAASDIYFPSHAAHDYELSCFCNHKYRVPAGSHQWGRDFLAANIDLITRPGREHEVFGRFKKYQLFALRSQIVTTLSTKLQRIELVEDLSEYNSLSAIQKLEEWTRFKCHWIVPTLNDISTRVFDALITGGIIIIPEKFRSDSILNEIDERDCFFHNEADIINPENIVRRALKSFDACGVEGVLRRHRWALNFHNLDSRVKQIIDTAREVLTNSFS